MSGENPCVLANLHTLNILKGSSENEMIGSSGVDIVPDARSFKPENGSINSLVSSEYAMEFIVKSLLDRSVTRSEAFSISGFLESVS